MLYKDFYRDYLERKEGYTFSENELRLFSILPKDILLYEVGYDFGDRLIYLKNNSYNIAGGCEFNPMFPAYGHKINNLYSAGMLINSLEIDKFNIPYKYPIIFSYRFLDRSSADHIHKIMERCDRYIAYEESLGGLYDSSNRS